MNSAADLKGRLPPAERQINPPAGGWKAHTLYLVLVSYRTNNPIHECYLKIGFVDENTGQPSGYSLFWNNNCDEHPFHTAHFVWVVEELHTDNE